ncbi:MAG: sigma 54-interacting transcriptional regulator, partial [bacterium]|nr:sigma 54-interacting transcriptional regulator [bacterium]
ERTFERLGGSQTISVDVRVISATHKDLADEIAAGRFREDLYYRLKVVDLLLPALRDRREDLPLLVQHFLERFNAQHGKAVASIAPEAMKRLMGFSWPGNVRQLMNVVERAVILSETDVLTVDLLSAEVKAEDEEGGEVPHWEEGASFQEAKRSAVRAFETVYICRALEAHGGNVSQAAPAMGMKRQALQQKLKELGIDPDVYRT